MDDNDCEILKKMALHKFNDARPAAATEVENDESSDSEEELQQCDTPKESIAAEQAEKCSYNEAVSAAAMLEPRLVPILMSEKVRRFALTSYCLIVLEEKWTLIKLYGYHAAVGYTFSINGKFQEAKSVALDMKHYGRYASGVNTVVSEASDLLCAERWLLLERERTY